MSSGAGAGGGPTADTVGDAIRAVQLQAERQLFRVDGICHVPGMLDQGSMLFAMRKPHVPPPQYAKTLAESKHAFPHPPPPLLPMSLAHVTSRDTQLSR